MEKLKIALILGTNRSERQSEKVARLIFDHLDKRDDIDPTMIDIRDFDFPQDNYGTALRESFPETQKIMETMDGFVIVCPEYNHSFPGVLKTFMDMFLKEYNNKSAAIATVSSGMWGGVRAAENMLSFLRMLGLKTASSDMNFPRVEAMFDEEGNALDAAVHERIEKALDAFVWLSKSLKWGRKNL